MNGHYLENDTSPKTGLAIARMVGHTTYLSNDAMRDKFGRSLRAGSFERGLDASVEFEVESYLRYQGDVFSEAFDANTYLLMTKALDYFDLAREYNDNPIEAFRRARAQFLVISFSSDWRFAPDRSQEIVNALVGAHRNVCYAEIDANQGHDAFLLRIPRYLDVFAAYMQRVADGGFR
jgi:homoserine O-acetyltransferase